MNPPQSQQTTLNSEKDALRFAFINIDTNKFIWTPIAACILAGIGMLTGLMTGLLGVGGGFLIVPLMRRFTHLAVPGIVATSLFVIALVGSGGVVNAVSAGAELPMVETSSFIGAMIGGMLMGRRVSRRLQPWQVQRGFVFLLFIVSTYMLFKAFLTYSLN